MWAAFEGGGMPRNSSPCGLVLQHDGPLIFHDVETQFPAAAGALPRIGEILLAPFRVDGRPIGTVWAIVHSAAKCFDSEDRRLLESVAQFAAAAYKMTNAEMAAREAEDRLDLVNHELAHRLKNMLAMVMAVASQTLKHVTEREAVHAFQKRLLALGSAHDILVDQTWVAASLQTIAEKVLGLIVDASRVTVSGPNVTLGPRSALTVSLILHELGTNAIKYGAFSRAEGRASFTWDITQDEEPSLRAVWREENGPFVTPPTKKSFGSQLINMGLIGAGGVKLLYQQDGLRAEFEAPLHLTKAMS
jgi:two-component sensor histidine kinase